MSKVNVEIEVPDRIRGTDIENKLLAKLRDQALEQAVVELYKEGEISSGAGAELLGMPLYDFIQLLGRHQVSIFNQTAEELESDVLASKTARGQVRET
jgi:predicted HTH domain antitoxin